MKIKQWLLLQKEGLVVGALIGIFLWWRGWNLPFNLPITNTYLNLIVMILIFGVLGMLIDAIWEPSR